MVLPKTILKGEQLCEYKNGCRIVWFYDWIVKS